MNTLLFREGIDAAAVHRFAEDLGLSRCLNSANEHQQRFRSWNRGEEGFSLIFNDVCGCGVFRAFGEAADERLEQIRASFPTILPDRALEEAEAAATPLARVRSLGEMTLLLRAGALPRERAGALLAVRLNDPHCAVRYQAFYAAGALIDPALDAAVEAAAAAHADMEPALASWRALRREREQAEAREAAAQARARLQEQLDAAPDEAALERLIDGEMAETERWALRARWFQARRAIWRAYACAKVAGALDEDGDEELALSIEDELPKGIAPDSLREPMLAVARALVDDSLVLADVLVRFGAGKSKAPEWQRVGAVVAYAANEDDDGDALSRALLKQFPSSPAAYDLRARVLQYGDAKKSLAALEGALQRIGGDDGEISAWYDIFFDPLTNAGLLARLAKGYRDAGRFAEALRCADALLELKPRSVLALQERALALTFLKRHGEAIAAYGEALAAMDEAEGDHSDARGLMLFNRACERARGGEREAALADLAAAVALRASWGERAQTDDYFASLWEDPQFVAIVCGLDAASIDPESVRGRIDRAMGLHHWGHSEDALQEGKAAVAAAELLGDIGLLSDALKIYGNIRVWREDPAKGLPLLERAVGLARRAWPDQPGSLSESVHLYGVALQAAGQLAAARAAYDEALALRVVAYGASAPILAKSYGDLARLDQDEGRPLSEVALTIGRGLDVVRAALGDTPVGEDRFEILCDQATLAVNLTRTLLRVEDLPGATAALTELEAAFTELHANERTAGKDLLQSAMQLAAYAVERGAGDEAMRVQVALWLIAEPDPEVREQRLWWGQLRLALQELQQQGLDGRQIAEGLAEAVRGGNKLPRAMAQHPALRNLSVELAQRLGGGGDMVLLAMALETAKITGDPGEAVKQLEELAIGQLGG